MRRSRGVAWVGVVLTVLVGAAAGRADEATAAAQIKKLGGGTRTFNSKPGDPVTFVELANGFADKGTDDDLKLLKEFKKLRRVHLTLKHITDDGIKELRPIKTLVVVNLTSTRVSDAGLRELKGLPKLRELAVSNTRVTD